MGKFTFVLGVTSVLAAGILLFFSYQLLHTEFPDVSILKTRFPVVRYKGPDQPPQIRLEKKPPASWVKVSSISKHAVGAIVVSEDWAFYQHPGYDAHMISEAIRADWERGKFARGASTITQQVVRNIFLDQDKNIWRKVKELYLAIQIEKTLNKNKILELYLNIAEWGQGIYGIGPASAYYFKKKPDQLTAKEGAFLAMLLPSPKRYSRSFKVKQLSPYARSTVQTILEKMTQARYLTQEELEIENSSLLSFELPF
jgi:monofunctional biosynthetic peptidoglycan transglycosylase